MAVRNSSIGIDYPEKMNKTAATNWLHGALGKTDAPAPPALDSDRVKDLIARALMFPGSLTPYEVQEMAASAFAYLVMIKKA